MQDDHGQGGATPSRWGHGTRAIHAGQSPDPSTGTGMTQISATSTYAPSSPGVQQGIEYSTSYLPTRFAYERCAAAMDAGRSGSAFDYGCDAT